MDTILVLLTVVSGIVALAAIIKFTMKFIKNWMSNRKFNWNESCKIARELLKKMKMKIGNQN